jgi:hypothetical protein
MKKSIIFFAVALGMLTACNPQKEEKGFDVTNLTSDQLLSGATFSQYNAIKDEAGNITGYEEAADGNWIKYNIPSVSSVFIFYKKADGSEFKLASGAAGGMFNFVPKRGSDPLQTVYFRYVNQDGEEVVASKEFTLQVAGELEMPVRYLASNEYGEKTWYWDPSITGAVWGNMGYQPGTGESVGTTGNGQWWGVTTSEEFNGQLQHTEDGTNHGDGDLNAYMTFSEDGILNAYDANGIVIRTDTYAVEGWDPSGEWKVGDLVTKAILWPYEINSGGNIPGKYEIVYLTSDKMTLVYPDGGSQGGWGEASFWHFCSNTDLMGNVAGYEDGKSWTWDPSVTGAVWGNMGYQPGDGASVGTAGNGQWWGVTTSEEFNGQLQHTEDGTNHGDGDLNAYMTFGTDGILKAYDANGNEIRSSAYEFVPVAGSDWKIADLKTTSILWPYEINSGGNIPGTYEVVYATGSQMTLVYPDGGSQGAWGEASFWHFKAK